MRLSTRLTQINAIRTLSNRNRKMSPNDIMKKFEDKINHLNKKLVSMEKQLFQDYKRNVSEKLTIVDAVERAICKPDMSQLVQVGSLRTQLLFDNSSDIDVCLLPKDKTFLKDFHKFPDFKVEFMQVVMEQIRKIGLIDPRLELDADIFPLIFTRVPLLVVKFKGNIMMDIQFPHDDYHSLRNTNLVRHYAAADIRFRQLYLWLKTLFIRLGVKNSKEGLLSSYHIILLVIHFLQSKVKPPVLPFLMKNHNDFVGPQIPLNKLLQTLEQPFDTLIDWHSENKSTVGQLAVELIDYYSDFNPHQTAISIGKGCSYPRKQFASATQLLLYDPFSTKTVANSQFIPDAFSITMTFIKRGQCLGEFLDSFPEFPEASKFRFSVLSKEFRPTLSQ